MSAIKGTVDDLTLLLQMLPSALATQLQQTPNSQQIKEIVLDLGFPPEVRYDHTTHRLHDFGNMTLTDIQSVAKKIEPFNTDNRAGIERTLHRVCAIRNRSGKIIGLTFRVGRAVEGTIEIIRDIIEQGQNCLFLGPPGIGKTTLLRETARVLSDACNKRVIVVDTSNEIAGDGDIPHPGIGYARRMQVHSPEKQHKVMIEAVENHMPEVIVVDEIGTSEEASAARTIAERGVQLVATAHGYQLENLINNPTLSDLIGGIQTVVLGDEEAKFRGSNKTVLERKNAPTFDAVIELKSRNKFVIHNPVAAHVDGILKDDPIEPETRTRQNEFRSKPQQETPKPIQATKQDTLHIYPLGIRASLIKSVALTLQIPIQIVTASSDADMILSTKSQSRSKTTLSSLLKTTDIPVHIIKKNTHDSLSLFFKKWFHLSDASHILEAEATREIQLACQQAISESRIIELSPQPSHIRRLQHQHTNEIGLNSMSVGEDPNRRVRVYPRSEN